MLKDLLGKIHKSFGFLQTSDGKTWGKMAIFKQMIRLFAILHEMTQCVNLARILTSRHGEVNHGGVDEAEEKDSDFRHYSAFSDKQFGENVERKLEKNFSAGNFC